MFLRTNSQKHPSLSAYNILVLLALHSKPFTAYMTSYLVPTNHLVLQISDEKS